MKTSLEDSMRGEQYRFANLFGGVHNGEKPGWQAIGLNQNTIAVRGKKTIIYGSPLQQEAAVGKLRIKAAAFRLAEDSAQFIDLVSLRTGDETMLQSEKPITLDVNFARGTCCIQSTNLKNTRTVVWQPEWKITEKISNLEKNINLPNHTELLISLEKLPTVIEEAKQNIPFSNHAQINTTTSEQETELSLSTDTTILPANGEKVVATIVIDLNDDAREDFLCARQQGITAVDQEGYKILAIPAKEGDFTSVHAGSVNGHMMILCGNENGFARAFDMKGNQLWEYKNTEWKYAAGAMAVYDIAIGDYAGNGRQQIALGCHDYVVLLNSDGTKAVSTLVWAHAIRPVQTVRLFDQKLDRLLINSYSSGFNILDPTVEKIFPWHTSVWGSTPNYMKIHQLDGGDSYLIYANTNGVGSARMIRKAWMDDSSTTNTNWDSTWLKPSDGETEAVLVEDLDGDGKSEVLTGNQAGFLICYNLQGDVLWKRLVGMPVRGLYRMDLQGNGERHIVAISDDPALTIYDPNWREIGGWSPSPARPLSQLWNLNGKIYALARDGEIIEFEVIYKSSN